MIQLEDVVSDQSVERLLLAHQRIGKKPLDEQKYFLKEDDETVDEKTNDERMSVDQVQPDLKILDKKEVTLT